MAVSLLSISPSRCSGSRGGRWTNATCAMSLCCSGTRRCSAFEPAAFDLVTSRMGVMFFADPVAAFRNIGGALKPGGRLVFACWAPLAENRHWLISYDIALRHLGPPAPPRRTSPARSPLRDPEYIRWLLAAAGFAEIAVERAHPTIIGGSPEEEARQAVMMGPTARLIEEKKPTETTARRSPARIEAAFAAEAAPARSGCRRPSFWSPPPRR